MNLLVCVVCIEVQVHLFVEGDRDKGARDFGSVLQIIWEAR